MISLRGVSKKFKLYRRPMDRVAEWMHLGRRHEEFWALRGIDLEIPRGRTVGIVGANGAGKSTLLKLITGTLLPTEGVIEIHGRVAALLELGTGFHPEFTGRQNIAINGQLLGLEPREVSRLEPEIIAFSELGPFIDQPIRTYSSGMIMRLGFSIAAATNPELLIVDEALSVGDARFSQKCIKRIREFRDRGTTILFVSHDPAAVTTLCDEAVLLERGRVRSIGSPRSVLEEYNALLAASGTGNVEMRISRVSDDSDPRAPRRHGTFQAVISRLELVDAQGRPTEVFHPGEELVLRARVEFLADAQEPSVGFLIKDRLGLDLFGTNTSLLKQELGPHRAGQCAEVEVRVPLRLGYGDYSITVAVHEDETHLEACYEWSDNAAVFRVRHREKPWWAGFVLMDPAVEVRRTLAPEGAASSALVERFPELPDPLPLRTGAPSPYLAGFFEPAQGSRGECRRTRALCRFVFRPAAPVLFIRAAIDDEPLGPDAPAEVTLRLVGGAELGTLLMEAPRGLLAWELPGQTAGEAHVFELEVRRPGGGTDGLDVYGVSSTHTAAEEEQWPVTTPSKSSTT